MGMRSRWPRPPHLSREAHHNVVVLARICMMLKKNKSFPDVLAGILAKPATSTNGRKRVVERVADKTPNLLAISICSVAKGAPSRSKCLKQKV